MRAIVRAIHTKKKKKKENIKLMKNHFMKEEKKRSIALFRLRLLKLCLSITLICFIRLVCDAQSNIDILNEH